MAYVPDFGSLAAQQKTADDQAVNQTNAANRPNQYNDLGSLTWTQSPNGEWNQTTKIGDWAQPTMNNVVSGQQNLSGQVGQGLNTSGLPGFGSSDLTSNLGTMPQVGQYNQEVINAWNSLQQPGLNQQAAAARARAAAQGLTLGSAGLGSVERGIGSNWNDASNKAILAGYTQGNTEYDQALRGRSQRYTENLGQSTMANTIRQQALGERKDQYGAAMSGISNLNALKDNLNPNNWAGKVPTSAGYKPTGIYGAAADTFSANQANENQAQAQANANRSANMGMVNTALGAANQIGWGNIGSGAKDLWNWGNNAYDTWNINNNVLNQSDAVNYGF